MRCILYVMVIVGLASCDSGKINAPKASSIKTICGQEIVPYVVIEYSNIIAGITSKDVFRLNEAGEMSHATWELNGTDVVTSSRTSLGPDVFSSVQSDLSGLDLQDIPDDGTLRQPGGRFFRVAFVTPDSIEHQSGALNADALINVVDQLRAESTLSSISGSHYWSFPLGGTDVEDIDINELGCEHPVSQALTAGIISQDVLLQTPEELTTFLGDLRGRSAFAASTPIGEIRFGIVPDQ